ncbi:tol-pal system protein YbgF [Chromatiales bacterium (ex Bugula neritina AB1)]|nr:tol-pal system protein YbgF [Chromatiales bacterium (ex Bugula neritina AB1)]
MGEERVNKSSNRVSHAAGNEPSMKGGAARTAAAALCVFSLLSFSVPAIAQNLEGRVQRLERILDNSVLINMVQRIESLQNEVRQLRGQLEERDNAFESMRERQRKLYLDTDSRITALEQGGGGIDLDSLDSLEELDDIPLDGPETTSTEGLNNFQVEPLTSQQDTSNSRQEQLDYQSAYDLLILGRNREAIVEFGSFLDQYPDGTYADNAHYWLGEANYVERQFNEAIDRFNIVIFQFPASRKVADARLRKGFALYELQRYGEARVELQSVEAEYQGRSIAALARRRIEQMNNAGL